jgi:eukaryotic-like serine/threonine-protein kinase
MPHTGTSIEIALAHLRQPLPPLPVTVPPRVTALVDAMAAKDPARRPAGARQVAARARQLRSELQARPAASSPAPRRDPATRRLPMRAAAHGEMSTAMLTDPEAQPDQPPRGHRLREFAARRPLLLAAAAVVAVIIALAGWLLPRDPPPPRRNTARPSRVSPPRRSPAPSRSVLRCSASRLTQ